MTKSNKGYEPKSKIWERVPGSAPNYSSSAFVGILRYIGKSGMTLQLFILYILSVIPGIAQNDSIPVNIDSSKCITEVFWDDIKLSTNNFINLGKSVTQFDSNDLLYISSFTGLVLLSSLPETNIRDHINEMVTTDGHENYKIISSFADRDYSIIFSAALYTGGLISGWDEMRTAGRKVVEAMVLSGFITGSLKMILGKARPYIAESNNDYRFFEMSNDYHSMPSGHTTVSFCIATILSSEIDRPWATLLLYGGATTIAWSRMYLNQHFLSDVVAGAGIGTLSALAVLNVNKKIEVGGKDISLLPDFYHNGLMLAIRF